jgi:hypothetical protein
VDLTVTVNNPGEDFNVVFENYWEVRDLTTNLIIESEANGSVFWLAVGIARAFAATQTLECLDPRHYYSFIIDDQSVPTLGIPGGSYSLEFDSITTSVTLSTHLIRSRLELGAFAPLLDLSPFSMDTPRWSTTMNRLNSSHSPSLLNTHSFTLPSFSLRKSETSSKTTFTIIFKAYISL